MNTQSGVKIYEAVWVRHADPMTSSLFNDFQVHLFCTADEARASKAL